MKRSVQEGIGLKKPLTKQEKEAQRMQDETVKKVFGAMMIKGLKDVQESPNKYRNYISGSNGKCFYTYYLNDYGSRVYTQMNCH